MLIPRKPLVQDAQLTHNEASGTAAAGCVVYMAGDQEVACVSASGHEPFGLLGQNVLAEPANLPKGHRFPSQLGSSDAFLGDPVMVAHGGGTYVTDYYLDNGAIAAGDPLYAVTNSGTDNGKLVNDAGPANRAQGADGGPKRVATAMAALTSDEVTAGKPLLINLEL